MLLIGELFPSRTMFVENHKSESPEPSVTGEYLKPARGNSTRATHFVGGHWRLPLSISAGSLKKAASPTNKKSTRRYVTNPTGQRHVRVRDAHMTDPFRIYKRQFSKIEIRDRITAFPPLPKLPAGLRRPGESVDYPIENKPEPSHRETAMFCRHILVSLGVLGVISALPQAASAQDHIYSLVIHGGAGTITRDSMTDETEAAYRVALSDALMKGRAVLESGGTALDAVTASIMVMEDSDLFNAGKGAVFTHDGRNELDAAIMDGRTLNAGAITGVTRVRNPITLARAVMEQSRHVMLAREGAEAFARDHDITLVSPTYFYTERRYQQLLAVQKKDKEALLLLDAPGDHEFGTVGAVALDKDGNIAAGTSTGGLTNKMWGRIGDSPIIGAGTYANNKSCGVSATGTGEYFIRATVAREICALMEYKSYSVQQAADQVIHQNLTRLGGDGGVIALAHDGAIAYSFNTEGMYRGQLTSTHPEPKVEIYKD